MLPELGFWWADSPFTEGGGKDGFSSSASSSSLLIRASASPSASSSFLLIPSLLLSGSGCFVLLDSLHQRQIVPDRSRHREHLSSLRQKAGTEGAPGRIYKRNRMVAASRESSELLAQDLYDMYMGVYDQVAEPDSITFAYKDVFEALYLDHPESRGKLASRAEREEQNISSSTLVYGEISFEPFGIFFEKIKNQYGGLAKNGGKFYDLGSGQGKPTFAAALLHDFDSCTGIELLKKVYDCSKEVLDVWEKDIKWELPEKKQKTCIDFVLGDVLALDWSDADVVFCNSTCFTDAIMAKLAKKADLLSEGSFFITTTRALPSKKYEIMEVNKMMETWGVATIFIQKKIA